MNFKTYQFEKLQLYAQQTLPIGLAGTVQMDQMVAYGMDALVLTLRAHVASDKTKTETIKYPETWWDAVLDRFVPTSWRDRLPKLRPTYRTYRFTTNYVYPNLELPKEDRFVRVVIGDQQNWLSDGYESEDV